MIYWDDDRPLKPIEGTFIDVAEAVIEPPKWVVEGVIPTGVTFIAAPPKSGKTTFILSLAASTCGVENGGLPAFMSHVVETGVVHLYSAEHSAGEIRYAVESGLECTVPNDQRFLVAEDPWSFRLDTKDGVDRLMFWLEEQKPKMFVLDPLRNFHDCDENDSGEMYAILRRPREWAKDNDAAFVVIHHTTKKTGDDQDPNFRPSSMRGSSAIFGMADSVHMLTPKSGGLVLVDSTFKRAVSTQFLLRLGSWGQVACEVLSNFDKQVGAFIAASAHPAADIATQLNVGLAQVTAALEKLKRNGYARCDGPAWRLTKNA